MGFDKINNSEGKETKERAQIIEELGSFSIKHNNKLVFKDFGLENNSKEEIVIKNEALEGLDKNDISLIKEDIDFLKTFILSPIFTDSFHLDHTQRRKWESDFIDTDKLSSGAKKYYHSNRLNINTGCGTAAKCIEMLNEIILNKEIKAKIDNLRKEIPEAFLNKHEIEKDVKILDYYILDDEKKVEVVEKLTNVIERILSVLEKK